MANILNFFVNFFYRCAYNRRIPRGYNYHKRFEALRFYSNFVIVFIDELAKIFLFFYLLRDRNSRLSEIEKFLLNFRYIDRFIR